MVMLGKLPKVHDPRTLKLIKYVSPGALPTAPLTLDLTQGVGNWPMYANDTHGDCLGPATKVLTADLKWVPISSLREGDTLLGFDEEPSRSNGRNYRLSTVEKVYTVIKPCFDLTFSDGTTVRASADHQWLRKRRPKGSWLTTSRMRVHGKRSSQVGKCFDVWEEDLSRDAGYLAGALDGEGCLTTGGGTIKAITFSQRDNRMLAEVATILERKGYTVSAQHVKESSLSTKGYERLILGNRPQVVKLLGAIRPPRLLSKFDPDRLGTLYVDPVTLVEKTDVGNQLVIAVQTSTRTFIAEGLTSHNCTCAAAAHMIEIWTQQISGSPRIFTDPDILSLYAQVNGGQDQGADELTVLRTWRSGGLAGDKIEAFCELKPSDNYMNKLACWLFSGLYIGIELPLSARGADLWDVTDGPTGAPGSWGGHAVNIIGYDDVGLTCITWGQIKKMTWRFWNKYVSESYAVFPTEYDALPVGGIKGVGLNVDQLREDLTQVGATLT